MKFESVISETKAKGEQVWLAFDHNGDQLQLGPKWLDGGIRGPLADYVFLIRVVSICDGCPFYSHQPLMAYVMFAACKLSPCACCPLAAWGDAHGVHCLNWCTVSFWETGGELVQLNPWNEYWQSVFLQIMDMLLAWLGSGKDPIVWQTWLANVAASRFRWFLIYKSNHHLEKSSLFLKNHLKQRSLVRLAAATTTPPQSPPHMYYLRCLF